MKPLVKIIETYDSNKQHEQVVATCIGCGKTVLKMVFEGSVLTINEYSKCDCPDVQHFEVTEEMAANNKYDNTFADMKFGKIATHSDKLEKEVDIIWPKILPPPPDSVYTDKDGHTVDKTIGKNPSVFADCHTPA